MMKHMKYLLVCVVLMAILVTSASAQSSAKVSVLVAPNYDLPYFSTLFAANYGKSTDLRPNGGSYNANRSISWNWAIAANGNHSNYEFQYINSKGKTFSVRNTPLSCWWNVIPWGMRCGFTTKFLSADATNGTLRWRVRVYYSSTRYGDWSDWATITIYR